MESSSPPVPFPQLQVPVESTYRACTVQCRFPSDNPPRPPPSRSSGSISTSNPYPPSSSERRATPRCPTPRRRPRCLLRGLEADMEILGASTPQVFSLACRSEPVLDCRVSSSPGTTAPRQVPAMRQAAREDAPSHLGVPLLAANLPTNASLPKPMRKWFANVSLLTPWMIWKHRNGCVFDQAQPSDFRAAPGYEDQGGSRALGASRCQGSPRRYTSILEELKKNPESHGGPPDTILLCRLRELILRELGFKDIFKRVKDEENANAMSLFEGVVRRNDEIEDNEKRAENLIRGILAGNIFDFGSAQLVDVFAQDGMSFLASFQNLLSRPWVIDDLDAFKDKWTKKSWEKAVIFVDNSGADIILGILPFARELLRRGSKVILAVNDMPCINDVTYLELVEIVNKLKDENGKLAGVDASDLLVVNSGNDMPVIDLSSVSPELAYMANDADLVVLEGNGRAIETNLYAQMKCDSINVGMVKHAEVAQYFGGRLYDCVFKFNEA